MTETGKGGKLHGHLRDGLALVGGLGVGVVIALGVGWFRSGDDDSDLVYAADDRVVSIGAPDLVPGAATPNEAIEEFLAAEISGRSIDSLELLSRDDRRRIRTTTSWDRSRRSRIGEILAYSPIDIEIDETTSSATATTTMELRPSLDLINGLTPPSLSAEWRLVEDDGWRIDYGSSVLTPQYLSAIDVDDVDSAAIAWLEGGQACDPFDTVGTAAVFRNSMPATTQRLCLGGAAPVIGPSAELTAADASQGLTAAFGSAVRDWARVVPVYQPAPADLVLAPVGDRWLVIDVFER